MKQESDFFEGKEPSLIYIAKKLKEALALEDVLTEAGVDYGVEADSYLEDAAEAARRVLSTHGYKPYKPD